MLLVSTIVTQLKLNYNIYNNKYTIYYDVYIDIQRQSSFDCLSLKDYIIIQ